MSNIVKKKYNKGLWCKAQVKVCVKKGVITAEEYKTITGEDYTA